MRRRDRDAWKKLERITPSSTSIRGMYAMPTLEISRRILLAGGFVGVNLVLGQMAEAASDANGAALGLAPTLIVQTFSSPRHATRFWEAGPADGPLMIFLHGWPEIGLMWRAQIQSFATEGWRCVAPDMRGYGGSSAPADSEGYALKEIVQDMVELRDHQRARPCRKI